MLQSGAIYSRYGKCFFRQGRPDFYIKQCVTFCVVVFKCNSSNEQFSDEFVKKGDPLQFLTHAEDLALREIELTEFTEKCTAVRVELYSSFSPCKKCCALLLKFTEQRSQCQVHIAFTCVYRIFDATHNTALRKLSSLRNVRLLDIFTLEEWGLLQNKGFLTLSPSELQKMQEWDSYWREKLKTIVPETYKDDERQTYRRVYLQMDETQMDTRPSPFPFYGTETSSRTPASRHVSPNMSSSDDQYSEECSVQCGYYKTARMLKPNAEETSSRTTPANRYDGIYVATKDELKEMDDLVKAAIRRQDRQDFWLMVMVVAIIAILLYFFMSVI